MLFRCRHAPWSVVSKNSKLVDENVAGPALVGDPGREIPLRKLLSFEYLGSFSVNNFEAFCECDEVY
jgi:hypothetical protein